MNWAVLPDVVNIIPVMKKNLLALMCIAFIIMGVSACGNSNSKKAKEASGDTEATQQVASTKGAATDALTGTKWTATYPLDLGEGKMGKVAGEENEWTIRYEDYEDEVGHVYLSEDGEELRVNWYMVNEVLTKAG